MSNSVEEMMRILVEEHAQRESAFARREREVQTQMTTMQQHMESLLRVVSDTTARTSPVNRYVDVKLVPLSEKNDIEGYLVTFKRIMVRSSRDHKGPVAVSSSAAINWKSSASICSIFANRNQEL